MLLYMYIYFIEIGLVLSIIHISLIINKVTTKNIQSKQNIVPKYYCSFFRPRLFVRPMTPIIGSTWDRRSFLGSTVRNFSLALHIDTRRKIHCFQKCHSLRSMTKNNEVLHGKTVSEQWRHHLSCTIISKPPRPRGVSH